MNEQAYETLEIGALKELLLRHVQTPMGHRLVSALRPSREREEIERSLHTTTECQEYGNASERISLTGIEDPEAPLAALEVEGFSLTPQQLLALERLAAAGLEAHDRLRPPEVRRQYPHLAEVAMGIPDARPVLAGVRGKILPGGEIDDNASPELKEIRRKIQVARARIHRHLESIIHNHARAMQEEIITFRNERFVVPVRTDARGEVPGVVHGLSSSGQTTYVEPLALIDQNNDLVRLREEEHIEIARILFSLTEIFRAHRADLRLTVDALAEIDAAQAKAGLSSEFRCVQPHISAGYRLRLRDARHILLEHNLSGCGGQVVPISLELDERNRGLVISGPNAGGKTVALKTVGLIALMAQMGLHVPASEAELPVFDQVFADIGDQQSIAANLSTFTAHMRNVSEMARQVEPPALVLIDEVGTGTDPDEGAALAIAIVDFFFRRGATLIATTHYNQLKMWASNRPGIVNASVEFNERTLQPTYRLLWGVAGISAGLQIAERMNVPAAILSESRGLLDPRHLEANDYLHQLKTQAGELEQMHATLAARREELDRERARLEHDFRGREAARRAELQGALAAILGEFRQESERLVADLKERGAAERMRKTVSQRAATLRRKGAELLDKAERSLFPAPAPAAGRSSAFMQDPRAGDRVLIRALGKQGEVESVRDGIYSVQVGPIRFRAEREDLELAASAGGGASRTAERSPSAQGASLDEEPAREINVIGMSADEAVARVDRFIDAAYFAGSESVRVIHGHGKGVLRRAIAALLTGHVQVRSFQPAPPAHGGGGVTVVQLKQD